MTTPSPRDAGLSCVYDLAIPVGAVEMAANALSAYGIRHGTSPDTIGGSRDVLAVHVVPPGGAVPPDDELKSSLAGLSARYPGVRFELALVVSRQGVPTRVWSRVAPGIARVETDFHVKETMPGGGLFGHDPRNLAAVFAGIRTRKGPSGAGGEDIQGLLGKSVSGGWHRKGNLHLWGGVRLLRFKVRKDAVREAPLHSSETPLKALRFGRTVWMLVRQRGALEVAQMSGKSQSNAFEHVKWALQRVFHPVALFFWALAVRRRKFSHFLLLGYNCELAYRFVMANGFLDSTFFAWTGTWNCEGLLNALSHLDELFTGELRLAPGGLDMFLDAATGVSTHSRYNPKTAGNAPRAAADIEAEKAEVRSRMAYLREKFLRQLRDEESTLAVVKFPSSDCAVGDRYAHQIIEQLRAMGGRNFSLLVVCQKADVKHFPAEHPDYLLRSVSVFNPDWQVATEQIGDRYGWMLLWKEFLPEKIIVQNKKFKFQQ